MKEFFDEIVNSLEEITHLLYIEITGYIRNKKRY
jgi:hypothetical protein